MITVSWRADPALIEYAAFNEGQCFPLALRWELAFSLFHSRLSSTMAVLECAINSTGLCERLLELYPHTLYRRWNPLQNGQFAPPIGLPDRAFDRVLCVSTLEHLLEPQQRALIAAIPRLLKPDGWLVLTWHSTSGMGREGGSSRTER